MNALFSILSFLLLLTTAYFSALDRVFHRYRRGAFANDKSVLINLEVYFKKTSRLYVTMLVGEVICNSAFIYCFLYSESSWIESTALIFLLATLLILLVGDVFPRLLVVKYPLVFLKLIAVTLPVVTWIFYPITTPILWLTDKFQSNGEETERDNQFFGSVTEDEIMHLVTTGEIDGAIEKHEKEMIQSVMQFSDTVAREVMVPRTEINAFDCSIPLSEIIEIIVETGYTRLPAYRENIDQIVGVLYAKDILKYINKDLSEPGLIEKLLHPPVYVPETKKLVELLQDFNAERIHIGVVVDEYGGTAGLITVEDILEEIVGEIEDEYDSPQEPLITELGNNEFDILSITPVDEVVSALKINIEENEEFDSIGGFLIHAMGKIPQIGESFSYKEASFKVIEADDRRIVKVRVHVNQVEELSDSIES